MLRCIGPHAKNICKKCLQNIFHKKMYFIIMCGHKYAFITWCYVGYNVYILLDMLITTILLYDFFGEVGFECSTQLSFCWWGWCQVLYPIVFSMKLVSNALPDVLMSANHWYWDHTRTDNIFEIVDNIVSGDFMLF